MIKPSKQQKNKKENVSKTQCQEWHCKKRLRERIDKDFTDEKFKIILNAIKNESSELISFQFVEKQTNRLKQFRIKFDEYEEFDVVYDKIRKQLVTVLFIEDRDKIFSYIDYFGNRINTKESHGKTWTLENNMIIAPGFDVVKIEENLFEIDIDGRIKRFSFDGFGELIEC